MAAEKAHEPITFAGDRLSDAAIRRSLAFRALNEAEKATRASVAEIEYILDITRHARRITIKARPDRTLNIYRARRGTGYSADDTKIIGEVGEGEEFMGTQFTAHEDGLGLARVAEGSGCAEWVLLGAGEDGWPDHDIVDIELEADVAGACEAILDSVKRDGANFSWEPRSLVYAVWANEENINKFSRHDSAEIALRWLIFSGQLVQREDKKVDLPITS